ncbi:MULTISPECIES: subtilase-type protease inhibitor [Streptomyces]|uniref:Probable subtilase-type protease inhibitor n=1 Tax=Streptomyces solicathayae TaxID=3081768 RepID=A0ABZ0LWD1_9ACTN|nr:subtilase-type protease inhibitor [Streptomyces sp. HUAS YS2]WOX23749.1 subtilase-type protease inhibitor [Streptomyces sp. HUAS YS2]
MRYVSRSFALTALATATGLALLGTATSGIAQAATSGLYPPSSLVLTIGAGETAETATVLRAVTLTCAPTHGGSHPAAASACAELSAVGGNFTDLTADAPTRSCTRQWAPVTITGDGVWQGRRVSWQATYANPCELRSAMTDGPVFAF